jgi:hypothetical protein
MSAPRRPGTRRAEKAQEVYFKAGTPIVPRSGEEIRLYFDWLEMVEPGVVCVAERRPEFGRMPVKNIIGRGVAKTRCPAFIVAARRRLLPCCPPLSKISGATPASATPRAGVSFLGPSKGVVRGLIDLP